MDSQGEAFPPRKPKVVYGSEERDGRTRGYPRGYGEMSDDKTSKPTESDGFNEALAELVHDAFVNGVNVEGAWDIYGDEEPEFSVEIYRLSS